MRSLISEGISYQIVKGNDGSAFLQEDKVLIFGG